MIIKNLWLETAQKYNQKLPNLQKEMEKAKALNTA